LLKDNAPKRSTTKSNASRFTAVLFLPNTRYSIADVSAYVGPLPIFDIVRSVELRELLAIKSLQINALEKLVESLITETNNLVHYENDRQLKVAASSGSAALIATFSSFNVLVTKFLCNSTFLVVNVFEEVLLSNK